MKLKQAPEDFRVEEISRLQAGVEGAFSLYRMSKRGLTTPQAVSIVARAWRLEPADVRYAGLKDRHAVTAQTISVRGGPRRNLERKDVKLQYLGRSPRPAGRGTLAGNAFRIVLRDLSAEEAARVLERSEDVARHGVPDYYDDQRFGSLRGTGGRFVARALADGDFEEALRLAIASPSPEDRRETRRRRTLLRSMWGRWAELAERLPRSPESRVCEALRDGASFDAAYASLSRELRSLHLSAYQAHVFNECLRRAVGPGPRHPGVDGPYVFFEGESALRDEVIPLASAGAPPHPLLDAVLADEGLPRERLGIFRRGARGAVVVPEDLRATPPEPDERNPGRAAVTLAFRLRPGSYATMIVKRCTYDVRRPRRR